MNKEELRALVAQMLAQREGADGLPRADGGCGGALPADGSNSPARGNALPADGTVSPAENIPSLDTSSPLPDITAVDLREQYLVTEPSDGEKFLALKRKTPARLGLGRAGLRYKTTTMLRFRADHAAARDSVFSTVDEAFAKENGLVPVQTLCRDKDEYLTRPDLGRRFDEHNAKVIEEIGRGQRVLLVIGDGLSSAAILANALDCAAAVRQGLAAHGIELGKSLFVRFCRVGASDHIGDLTGCELVCLLVGERPGLVTNESMSCYMTYKPRCGIPESKRTVISNIHRQGVPAVEAGAHIAAVLARILRQKASGVDLREDGA